MNILPKDVFRYDSRTDRYQHLEAGKPGKYHLVSAAQAALMRNVSKAKRSAKGITSGQTMVTGRRK